MKPVLPILTTLVLLLGLHSLAQAVDDNSSRRGTRGDRRELRALTAEIAGGASLLAGVSSSRSTQTFHEHAREFSNTVRQRGRVGDDWREVRSSFEAARQSTRRGDDPRIAFLVSHLQEDIAAADSLMGAYVGTSLGGGEPAANGRISFIDRENCVGTRKSDRQCATPRESLTFRIPREVAVINRLDGEWRDFGRGSNAEIYVNDRLVWRTDVYKDWDGDGTDLNVRVAPGSTLTVRSSTGDPIWIRRLTVETLATASADRTYRNPWDFPWKGRN